MAWGGSDVVAEGVSFLKKSNMDAYSLSKHYFSRNRLAMHED